VKCLCRQAMTVGKCASQGGKLGVVSSGTARLTGFPCRSWPSALAFRWPAFACSSGRGPGARCYVGGSG
jgi:hypothetical protein